MLKNPLWWCQNSQALHSYKRTVKAYYQHAATASMGMDPWTGWVLFQILLLLYLYTFSAAQGFSGSLGAALNSDKEPGQSYVWFSASFSPFIK